MMKRLTLQLLELIQAGAVQSHISPCFDEAHAVERSASRVVLQQGRGHITLSLKHLKLLCFGCLMVFYNLLNSFISFWGFSFVCLLKFQEQLHVFTYFPEHVAFCLSPSQLQLEDFLQSVFYSLSFSFLMIYTVLLRGDKRMVKLTIMVKHFPKHCLPPSVGKVVESVGFVQMSQAQ